MHSLPLAPSANIIRLSGRSLVAARSLWLVGAVSATFTFLVALPSRWALLEHPSPATLAHLTALGLTPTFFAAYSVFWEIVIAAPCAIIGFIIFWRCGEERIALLTSLMLIVFGVGSGTLTPTIRALLGVHPALDFLQHTFEFLAWYTFGLFFYLFPTGRFVPGWTRWAAAVYLPLTLVWNYAGNSPWAPLNWPPWLALPFLVLQWGSWLYSQVYRYRRASTAVERQQTKWVVVAVIAIILTLAVVSLSGALVPGFDLMSEEQPTPQAFGYMLLMWLISPALMFLPIALAFSIMRHRLWDIDRFISRAVVYGALTAFVIGAYVLVVGGLGALFQSSGNFLLSLLATGLIALAFNPLRDRLQRGVNRLMFGERADPYAALSRFSQKLEATLAPDTVLPTIVETVAQMLKLPYAAIFVREGGNIEAAAVFGSPVSRPLALPITYQHQALGLLHVAPPSADEPFTPAERRLLDDLTAQIGIALHNVRLAADLQRSREQLVTAREEERRRLRRDLHDGLGPKLAGQTLKLEAALDSLDGETETARALLQETMSESQTVIAEIRRLVYGLRPPALDQLGLLTAVREQATQYQLRGLQVMVNAPDSLPPLPAAVEVAAYRIIQEAVTNVARHAQAKTCMVAIEAHKENLRLEIGDDGVGLPPEVRAGVGLSSMRERAEEIGGACVIENGANGGTRVTAQLPISNPPIL